jgi:hypothetical protein
MNTDEVVKKIQAIESMEDVARVDALIREQPGPMAPEVQKALIEKLADVTANSKQKRHDMIAVLSENGVDYPLTDWLTPKNYIAKFGVKNVETVLNWINRGIIPADHIKEIPELGLRLVKAVEYSPRTYKERESVKDAS